MNQSSLQTSRKKVSRIYASQTCTIDRDAMILKYLPMVRHLVNKITTNIYGGWDFEDLLSAGTVGLVKAAQNFISTRKCNFKTYAYIRIRGAILDELRSKTLLSSNLHSRIKHVKKAYADFRFRHGRPASDEELAKILDIQPDELYRILEAARSQTFLSLHGLNKENPSLDGFQPVSKEISPDSKLLRQEQKQILKQAIKDLPQRDRMVLLLYYNQDLTMKEIAHVLEITEARVSQIHSSALFKLSVKLKGLGDEK